MLGKKIHIKRSWPQLFLLVMLTLLQRRFCLGESSHVHCDFVRGRDQKGRQDENQSRFVKYTEELIFMREVLSEEALVDTYHTFSLLSGKVCNINHCHLKGLGSSCTIFQVSSSFSHPLLFPFPVHSQEDELHSQTCEPANQADALGSCHTSSPFIWY